jgi:hypothetical protein
VSLKSLKKAVWRTRYVYPGSRFRLFSIPDPTFFHPGSRIRTVSIPDPESSSKNLSISVPKKSKKWFLCSKKYDPGSSSRIRMLTFSHPGSRIQGSKRHPIPYPDPQHLKKVVGSRLGPKCHGSTTRIETIVLCVHRRTT